MRHNTLLLAINQLVRYVLVNVLTQRSVCRDAVLAAHPGMCPSVMPCHVVFMQLLFTVFAGQLPLPAATTCVILGIRAALPFAPSRWNLWFTAPCSGSDALYLATSTVAALVMMARAVINQRNAWRAFQRRRLLRKTA